MSQIICILGRQPALGMAELESLYGSKALQAIGNQAVLVDVESADFAFDRLGGTMKACKLLTYINSTEWPAITQYIENALPQHMKYIPAGKIHLGLSLYGFNLNASKINAGALGMKKALKSANRGVRVVPNKAAELNAAQVIHNQLTGPNGIELVMIRWGKKTVLAQTIAVQDIDAYAARDQARPKRDARVGMLPPKLAQIIINLATGELAKQSDNKRILDPFCGTGVLPQESLLMGYRAYGTDLEPRMIDYSQINLNWLTDKANMGQLDFELAVGDATSYQWQAPVDAIACETYLGRPFGHEPKPEVLAEVMQDVDTIHRKFLKNVARQTEPGFRMTIAIPAWKTKNGFKHLQMLDSLEEIGYNRVSFVHSDNRDLIYHRENQVVARELVTLIRK